MKKILNAIYNHKNAGKIIDFSLNLSGLKFNIHITLKTHDHLDIVSNYDPDKNYYTFLYSKKNVYIKHRSEDQIIEHLRKMIKVIL